mmetsp:Transcript_26528/g.94620  ORF Transcript_26528/g.94620 Transcript_26528/m.94620 type:complete len:249 (-) Transcript_26528:2-748(-)
MSCISTRSIFATSASFSADSRACAAMRSSYARRLDSSCERRSPSRLSLRRSSRSFISVRRVCLATISSRRCNRTNSRASAASSRTLFTSARLRSVTAAICRSRAARDASSDAKLRSASSFCLRISVRESCLRFSVSFSWSIRIFKISSARPLVFWIFFQARSSSFFNKAMRFIRSCLSCSACLRLWFASNNLPHTDPPGDPSNLDSIEAAQRPPPPPKTRAPYDRPTGARAKAVVRIAARVFLSPKRR